MIGLWIGTLCLIGLIFVVLGGRSHRHAYAYGGACGGPGPWMHGHAPGRGPFGHGHFRRRFFYHSPLSALLSELDTTPGQEKVVREAVAGLVTRARATAKEARMSRGAFAEVVASKELDRARLQSWLDGHEQRLRSLGADLSDAIARIHEVLDDEQRARLGKLVESGHFRRHFGGYC